MGERLPDSVDADGRMSFDELPSRTAVDVFAVVRDVRGERPVGTVEIGPDEVLEREWSVSVSTTYAQSGNVMDDSTPCVARATSSTRARARAHIPDMLVDK